jgi:hypothetical protein
MMPMTEPAVRSSFVNCSKGEAKRIGVPKDLAERPWADLDFLGWRDGGAAHRAYLVAESDAGPVGVVLRVAAGTGLARRSMCSFCLTVHAGDGVALMSARKAGPAGRTGDSVGAYLCSDLSCSLNVRGLTDSGHGMSETLSIAHKIERTVANLDAFLRRVRAE